MSGRTFRDRQADYALSDSFKAELDQRDALCAISTTLPRFGGAAVLRTNG